MIRLTKSAKPTIIERNQADWTQELLDAGDKGKAKSQRYGHEEIKSALIAETNGKCAYCESKVLATGYGHVEHIVAKSQRPELAYEWQNITLGCDRCNINKGSRDDILDPYATDPASALDFLGPLIAAKVGSELGRVTVTALKLNRTGLLERRAEKLSALRDHLDAVRAVADPSRRDFLLSALAQDAEDAATEFSAVLTEHIGQLRAQGHIPSVEQATQTATAEAAHASD